MLNERHVSLWRGMANLIRAVGRLLPSPGLWASVTLVWVVTHAAASYADGLTPVHLILDGVPRTIRTGSSTVGEMLDALGVVVNEWDRLLPERESSISPRMSVEVRHARPVTVQADNVERTVYTHSNSAEEILREAGIEIREGDGLLTNRGLSPALAEAAPWHVEVKRATVLYLDDDGVEQTLRTPGRTVGQVLAASGNRLYVGDRVYPNLNTPVSTGLHIRIERGVLVSVALDGQTLRARTHCRRVGDLLAELGISLIGSDFTEPSVEAPIQAGMRVEIVRVREEEVVEREEIPFETEWVADSSLELDHRRLEDAGTRGIKERRYRITYHDGQEVQRVLLEQGIAQEPRSRRIAFGTRIVIRTLDTPDGPVEYWRRIRVFLTSYTAADCGKAPDDPEYGITRLGWRMRHGIIAADPRVIRLRSELYVPGYGRGIAGDTGGLIKGRHIDLGYEEDGFVMHYEWGYVYVLTPVPPPSQIAWILPDSPRER